VLVLSILVGVDVVGHDVLNWFSHMDIYGIF
jgi:hypothetical protein